MTIRNEQVTDYREVEELTRKAFWNVHTPGCFEHYLVNKMRSHADFIKELSFVIEHEGQIIANIMYTKAVLICEDKSEKTILTFGPFSVLPSFQRKGYGKLILEHSFKAATALGYDAIVILGNPENYISSGFKHCSKYGISMADGIFWAAMLVKELQKGAIKEGRFIYKESSVYEIDEKQAEEFDKTFEPLVKEYKPSQELFDILSRSRVCE